VSGTENVPKRSVAAEISNATVKLMHEYTGRGPTKARTYMDEEPDHQLVAAVERYSGRKMRVFLSDNHVDPDVAVESFLLVSRDQSMDGSSGATPRICRRHKRRATTVMDGQRGGPSIRFLEGQLKE
jgi:uncharacterized protein YbcI